MHFLISSKLGQKGANVAILLKYIFKQFLLPLFLCGFIMKRFCLAILEVVKRVFKGAGGYIQSWLLTLILCMLLHEFCSGYLTILFMLLTENVQLDPICKNRHRHRQTDIQITVTLWTCSQKWPTAFCIIGNDTISTTGISINKIFSMMTSFSMMGISLISNLSLASQQKEDDKTNNRVSVTGFVLQGTVIQSYRVSTFVRLKGLNLMWWYIYTEK